MNAYKKVKPRGKPAVVISAEQRKQVELMSGLGIPQPQIALVAGLTEITMRRRCAPELAIGIAKANTAVLTTMYQQAMAGNTAFVIFWAKVRCGWREVNHHEISGKDGVPLIPTPVAHLNLDKLSSDQIEAQLARTERLILALEGKGRGGGK